MRDETSDVLVIVGGTAGFGAALAAARQALCVPLFEATSKTGGVMAFFRGMPCGGGYPVDRTIGGSFAELTDRLTAMDSTVAERRLRRGRPGSLLPARCRLVHEGRSGCLDGHGRAVDGRLATRQDRRAAAPLRQGVAIHQRHARRGRSQVPVWQGRRPCQRLNPGLGPTSGPAACRAVVVGASLSGRAMNVLPSLAHPDAGHRPGVSNAPRVHGNFAELRDISAGAGWRNTGRSGMVSTGPSSWPRVTGIPRAGDL